MLINQFNVAPRDAEQFLEVSADDVSKAMTQAKFPKDEIEPALAYAGFKKK